MLEVIKQELTNNADMFIPNWRKMSKLELAKGYVENENVPEIRDAYFNAFALRFWHEVPTLYRECIFLVKRLNLTPEDILDWYFEGLFRVFEYRAFMNPEVFTYVKDGNEDKFLNGYVYRAIDSVREYYFQHYNFDKRKSNINALSLDSLIEEKGEWLMEDKSRFNKYKDIDKLITKLVEENNIYEALVIYAIVYGDSFSKIYVDGKCKAKYSPSKLSHIIKDLTEDEITDFTEKYAKDKDIFFEVQKYRYFSRQWNRLLYASAIKKLQSWTEVKDLCY